MPNDHGFAPRSGRNDVVDAALTGLTSFPKTLPPWLFYDEEGCRLFYQITNLPEYYLTRTEKCLLAQHARQMVPLELNQATLVEFGGSDESKATYLLDLKRTDRCPTFKTYVSIDVAGPALAAMRARLQLSHPQLDIQLIVADFNQPLHLPETGLPRFGFFPGSTIGNLNPDAAVSFLRAAFTSLGSGGHLLIGADLRKDPTLILPAYNDAAGVTAAFNLNLLRRLNQEAGANFDQHAFRHEAIWNESESRIEMHLVSETNQSVMVGGHQISFRRNESVHTENSYKYAPETLIRLAQAAGWTNDVIWTDPVGLFGIFLLTRP